MIVGKPPAFLVFQQLLPFFSIYEGHHGDGCCARYWNVQLSFRVMGQRWEKIVTKLDEEVRNHGFVLPYFVTYMDEVDPKELPFVTQAKFSVSHYHEAQRVAVWPVDTWVWFGPD